MLIINYKAKKNNNQLKLYYEALKGYTEKELYEAIIKTIRENKYFPNIHEIVVNIPHIDIQKFNEWDKIQPEKLDKESKEYKELEELLKEFK